MGCFAFVCHNKKERNRGVVQMKRRTFLLTTVTTALAVTGIPALAADMVTEDQKVIDRRSPGRQVFDHVNDSYDFHEVSLADRVEGWGLDPTEFTSMADLRVHVSRGLNRGGQGLLDQASRLIEADYV